MQPSDFLESMIYCNYVFTLPETIAIARIIWNITYSSGWLYRFGHDFPKKSNLVVLYLMLGGLFDWQKVVKMPPKTCGQV